MVPKEQYDALKAKFIENETSAQKRLESIDALEAQIKKREDQMMEMERIFNQRLDEAKEELVSQNKEHKDRERMIRLEIKEAREEGQKEVAKM